MQAVAASEGSFAASLRCDMAEAVRASDTRFEYCGVAEGAAGCVVAMLNVLPDAVGHDTRTPTQVGAELQSQARDAASLLRRLNVGSAVTRIEVGEKRPRKAVSVAWAGVASASAVHQQAELDELEREYARRYVDKLPPRQPAVQVECYTCWTGTCQLEAAWPNNMEIQNIWCRSVYPRLEASIVVRRPATRVRTV